MSEESEKLDRSVKPLNSSHDSISHSMSSLESSSESNVQSDIVESPPTANDEEKNVAVSAPSVGPPPNGGLLAWLQVVAAFLAFFNSWGIVNSFGAFQLYYASGGLSGETNSAISWIGSVQGFFVVSGSIFAGRLLDAGYLRSLVVTGTIMLGFGLMMTSLSTKFYQVFLAQGVCLGLGSTLMFVSSVGVVASYFTTRRAFAIGIVATGSSFGGVIYPIMVHRLIAEVGYPWAARIFGFVVFSTSIVPCILLKARLPPRKSGPPVDYASLRDPVFMLYTGGTFLGFMGIYIPIFYISTYATALGINPELAFYFLPILNAGSVVGRLLPNFLADKTGPINMFLPCTLFTGVMAFAWMGIFNEGGLFVFALLYGFFSGSFVSLPPACISSLTSDLSTLGTRLGMNFFISGFGVLVGTPIAGALIAQNFLYAKIFCAVCITVAACLIASARFLLTGRKVMVRV
jgi:MFS family permease